jgi:hypothetical protein
MTTFTRERNLLIWAFRIAGAATTVLLLGLFFCLCAFRGHWRSLFVSLLAIDVGLMLMTAAVRSILTGELTSGRSGLWKEIERRTEEPQAFWRAVSVLAFTSVALLALGGGGLLLWS